MKSLIGRPSPLRYLFLLPVVALGVASILATNPSSVTSPNSPQVVNPAVEITVSFDNGATTPSTVKSFAPTSWDGDLCSPSSLQFVGIIWSATSDAPGVHVYVRNFCSAASNPTLYICTPAGAPRATDGLAACAVDPTLTSESAFSGGTNTSNGGGVVGPFTNTPNVTSLVVFYCASGDAFIGPPAVAHVSCSKL